MPQRRFIRFWCDHCKEFTIQEFDGGCLECGTVTKEYMTSEIPVEKVIEQRQRYKDAKRKGVFDILNVFSHPNSNVFDEPTVNIKETDAGQIGIDEREKARFDKQIAEINALREEYNVFYKNTGRNEPCPCGKIDENGKPMKYKKCCLITKFKYIR